MYKLIAIDLDGTLLNSYGEISNENKEAIQKAIKKGTKVVLASRKNATGCKNNCKRNWSKRIYNLRKWYFNI
ncbi:MAG: HAD hydrolase family protein [Clostridia bacterium]|nr:HAD hydrolase family protein [Clostridia bacterium]